MQAATISSTPLKRHPLVPRKTRILNGKANKSRPGWDQRHNGMTWRDMPCQSQTDVTYKKLSFALYRMGLLDIQTERLRVRRMRMGDALEAAMEA